MYPGASKTFCDLLTCYWFYIANNWLKIAGATVWFNKGNVIKKTKPMVLCYY
jgi:hypothetical protein